MDIHNGKLYWPTTFPEAKPRQSYEKNELYDAIVVGGGMSGALTALTLAEKGCHVAVIDKRQVATGSTMANTGLLQYSNDIMLHELIDQIGERDAVRFYKLCYQSVKDLGVIAASLPIDAEYIERPSICFASTDDDVEKLKAEYDALTKHGFPCDYWGPGELIQKMGFAKPAALITHEDAEINPYKFVQGIFDVVEAMNGHIFEFTDVLDIQSTEDNTEVITSAGSFFAKNVIVTTGYETTPVGKRIGADINRSYAMTTKPLPVDEKWPMNAMIWETKRPYLYIRTTKDGRILAGGLDEDKAEAPSSQELIQQRAERLLAQLQELFPQYDLELDHAYGATFGESLDNLPFIGEHPTRKHLYYLLGYGGNGTVYSMIGSQMIRDLILLGNHPDVHIVQLNRPEGVR